VFWLAGHAGAGKSTIAYSIAQHYDRNSELLAANFFCSRQFEDAKRRKYIIPSVAYQLARHSSSFRSALVTVNQFGSCDEPDKQLKELLVEPWTRCLRDREFQIPSSLVIVDALDEIAEDEGPNFLQELLGA
jgi:uridine kinase